MALPEVLSIGLKGEVQGAVGQTPVPAAEQLVHRPGVEHQPLKGFPVQQDAPILQGQAGGGVHPGLYRQVGVVQQPLEHGGIALQRHALVNVLKIPAVLRQEHRHPGGGGRIDLLRLLPPLLHGVADKHMVVYKVGQCPQVRIGALPQLQNSDLPLRAVGLQQLLLQSGGLLRRKGRPERYQVEGHRQLLPAVRRGDVGHYLVLIVAPGGKAGKIVEYPPAVGVENVGTVPVDQHAVLVKMVVSVAAHMVPALQHQDLLAAPLRQLPGGHGSRHARADDQAIVWLVHREFPLSIKLSFIQADCTTQGNKNREKSH